MATVPASSGSSLMRRCRAARAAERVHLDEPVPELTQLGARSPPRPRGSPCAPRGSPSKRIGSPHATETGCQLPDAPGCEPWIAAGTTGTPSWSATIAAPGCTLPARRSAAASPRRRDPSASPSRTTSRIRRTASRSDSPRRTENVPKLRMSWPRPGMRCASTFAMKWIVRGARGAERGRIDPVEVVEGEHDAALPRHALDAVDAQRHEELDDRLHRDAADAQTASRGSCRLPRPDERLDAVDDLLDARVRRVDLDRVGRGRMLCASRSSRSRRSVASASAPMPGRSAMRRSARTDVSATRVRSRAAPAAWRHRWRSSPLHCPVTRWVHRHFVDLLESRDGPGDHRIDHSASSLGVVYAQCCFLPAAAVRPATYRGNPCNRGYAHAAT